MKNTKDIEFKFSELKHFVTTNVPDYLRDDFIVSLITMDKAQPIVGRPLRFDSYLACFCVRGKFEMDVDLRQYDISEGSLIICVPGNILCLNAIEGSEDAECVVVAVSRDLLSNAKIDFNTLHDEALTVMANPCIKLDDKEIEICRQFYFLSEQLILSGNKNIKESMLALGTSIFHYLGSLWSTSISEARTAPNSALRSKMLFEDFMKLVTDYHNTQRDVDFYAKKLCLTPKYLSRLVRKVSGKSAPEWIDAFIMLEAKNYLKYSDMEIKEIVYKLNFSSAPVFYRFFKTHTGMTPAEYRKL